MKYYDTYEPGTEYFTNPIAIELKKFARLPHKEFLKKYNELKLKYEMEGKK